MQFWNSNKLSYSKLYKLHLGLQYHFIPTMAIIIDNARTML